MFLNPKIGKVTPATGLVFSVSLTSDFALTFSSTILLFICRINLKIPDFTGSPVGFS